MSRQRNRSLTQRGLMDAYGSYNPGDAMDTPLDDLIYIVNGSAEGTIDSEDPPFFKGLSSYILGATYDSSTGVVALTWTYPDLSLLNTSEFLHTTVDQVILQRSSSSRSTPFSQSGIGPHNANVNTAGYTLLPSDPAWTTLLDSRPGLTVNNDPANYNMPKSLNDTPPMGHVYNYRLIVLLRTHTGSSGGTVKELDWNVVTVITPFALNVQQGYPNTLSWVVPSLAEMFSLPGFNTLGIVRCTTIDCFASLNWSDPVVGPVPVSYSLYKTVNGSTFENVANDAQSPFADGQQPGVGITFRYKIVAHLADGSDLTSNIVSINRAGTTGT